MAKKKNYLSVLEKVRGHLEVIYPELEQQPLAEQIVAVMGLDKDDLGPKPYRNNWSKKDVITITYGDSISETMNDHCKRCTSFSINI